jgi:acetylornithine deacetylase/succinyl-diaminopimelate desuccinylase-like protein
MAVTTDLDNLLAQVQPLREEIVAFHQAIVRIPTVNTGVMPTGNETPCCEYIRDRLAAEGIESEILESAPTRGNLIARLEGEGGGPSLLFMTHLDVVPIEDESAWTHPPFSATLADGKVWGRGSDDCKAVTTAAFFATILLKRSGLARKGDVIFTGTADEESGGFYGYGWLAEHHPDKIRADFAINEGGSGPMPSHDGLIYGLPLGEKGRVEVTITIAGRSGHASRPWAADNALEKAGRVLTAIAAYQPEIDLSHPIFDHLGEMVEGLERPTPETLEDTLARIAEVHRPTSVLLRGLTRMTLTPTVLHAGVKSNSIPATAVLKCDVRSVPGQDAEYVKGEVEKTVQGIDGVSVEVEVWARSSQSPFGTPFTNAIEHSLALAVDRPDLRLIPSFTAGFTDSQWVRPLGVEAYGFNPIHPEGNTARAGVHGVDESIEVDALVARTKAYLAAAYFTVVEGLKS